MPACQALVQYISGLDAQYEALGAVEFVQSVLQLILLSGAVLRVSGLRPQVADIRRVAPDFQWNQVVFFVMPWILVRIGLRQDSTVADH